MNRLKIVGMLCLAAVLALGAGCQRKGEEEGRGTNAQENTAIPTAAEEPSSTTPATGTPAGGPSSATATLQGAPGDDISGTVTFHATDDGVHVVAEVQGVDGAGKHGFHVHENGQCDHQGETHFSSAGGHFNPTGVEHACPPTDPRHAGDLGNIEVGANGSARMELAVTGLSLSGPNSVIGKAIILHANPDDCKTQPTGNAGDRLACGVVTAQGGQQ
ncbi:MAG TPA: superoxide dismutase family protein [Thermoanaerobaculia bacterium]|nr:superoxide dismutase family protein [Thermoanaerobaculia bacterium]